MLRLHFVAIFLLSVSTLNAQPLVVTSVNPIRAVVRDITASSLSVRSLVTQSAHEHAIEITPQQVQDLAHADLIVLVGLGQEAWSDALPQASKVKIVEFASSLDIQTGDPHLWLDPVLVADFIPTLTSRLCQIERSQCENFKQRAENIRSELLQFDQELQAKFSTLKHDSIIVFHPAWSRFAARYKLKVLATLTASGDEEPSARTLLELARSASAAPIIVEPSTPLQVKEALVDQLHSKLVTLDPQSDGESSYLEFIRQNSQRLLNVLQDKS